MSEKGTVLVVDDEVHRPVARGHQAADPDVGLARGLPLGVAEDDGDVARPEETVVGTVLVGRMGKADIKL